MTRAERMLSMPPLRTPAITNRRNLLAQAAAGVASGALTLPLPKAVGAARPAADPILVATEAHRASAG